MRTAVVLPASLALIAFAGIVGLAGAGAGCGSDASTFDDRDGGGGADQDGNGPILTGDGAKGDCVGLECKQVTCAGGKTTTLSGTVLDPAGKVPLYNVIVYVPNAQLEPFPEGASCDKCGSSVSGAPVVTTLTDAAGHFTLENVPVTDNLPLVIQIGKWRRRVTIPTVASCADTRITDTSLTRLPRNKSEGDSPRIALTTGGCDPLECLLRKIGIDDAELTAPAGNGRVHVFQGKSSPDQNGQSILGGELAGGSPPATTLWSDAATLAKYDVLLLACECSETPETKPAGALKAMFDYASAGGRIFASHYHYYWFENPPALFPTTATWDHQISVPPNITATIDDSFPKGVAFKQWMLNVGGSPAPGGTLEIGQARGDVSAVPAQTSQRWIYLTNPPSVQYYTFNTPATAPEEQQCGRVVYSDLHVSGGVANGDAPGKTFPAGCTTTDLSPQEKALEFMLFDLSSCVQSDKKPPQPPPR
jgi:hypothetical protein